jgi:predicted bacteriocin transport accessory protein
MQKNSGKILNSIFLISLLFTTLNASQGKFTGGSTHSMPEWFKDSFLEMSDDVEEANESNKHVILFMTLKFCPYCTKMLKNNFSEGSKLQPYIKENFDVIGLDIKGSKEIAVNEDLTLTEKEYAKYLNVQYTPTLLFLDQSNKVVVRINGYRSSENFKYILDFVKNKEYKNMKLTEYIEKVKNKTLYSLKENKLFQNINDLSKIDGPLAVIFEDGSCTQCDYLHNNTFKNKDVIQEISKFTLVRFDANSKKEIITPSGKITTAKKWAKNLGLDYRPGILLFNNKIEQARIDALLYSFHFKELFRFVSTNQYKIYKSFLDYLKVRQSELLEQGINIDISDK